MAEMRKIKIRKKDKALSIKMLDMVILVESLMPLTPEEETIVIESLHIAMDLCPHDNVVRKECGDAPGVRATCCIDCGLDFYEQI